MVVFIKMPIILVNKSRKWKERNIKILPLQFLQADYTFLYFQKTSETIVHISKAFLERPYRKIVKNSIRSKYFVTLLQYKSYKLISYTMYNINNTSTSGKWHRMFIWNNVLVQNLSVIVWNVSTNFFIIRWFRFTFIL